MILPIMPLITAEVGDRESTAEIFKELKLVRVDQINELEISILMFRSANTDRVQPFFPAGLAVSQGATHSVQL